ncbi:MAG: PPOX class F420-dependent oxidoreductase [Candidatus Dormibacteria bacterium]
MTPDEARQFVAANHHAVLATRRRDGSPQMSPVVAALDPQGLVVVSTRETAVKALNLRRQPRCQLLCFTDRFFGPWVAIGGTAEIQSLPEAMPGLEGYYRAAVGEHPDWAEYRAAMVSERRLLIRIRIEEAGPNASG